ncbi:MAG: ATP-binding protein [Solirubrobacteraceae bacterium]
MAKIILTLLGGFAAEVDGEPVPDAAWRLKKARELVKLLALAPGHRLLREQAMDELWRDRPPDAAANNLNQAVYVARRALHAEAIAVREGVLELDAEIDVDRFEAAAAAARDAGTPAAYRTALALYPGDLLPENRYDDWAAQRRDDLVALADALGDELAALGAAAAGRRSALPADAGAFVGRARELEELMPLLRGRRLLTLAGPGGVGKTRLALQLARTAEPAYADGAALVELAPIGDPRLVPDAVATALDVRPLQGQELVDALVDLLAPRTFLLVIDNCEHVLGATARLADALLRAAPQLTILATSREPLRATGEVVFRVPSLDIPDPESAHAPEELLGFESVQLFVERAQAAAPGFELDRDNAGDIVRICHRLDGLPLALELAAGRIGSLGPAAIADRLGDRFRVLRSGSHAAPTRQQTLSATLQWSHDLLEPDERVLFRRLAAFAGSFDLEAAETVCAGDGADPADIVDVLARLVEKSLVAVDERSSRERRYRLLETVRIYADERLDDAGERAAFAAAHARWAFTLATAERGSPRLDLDAANLRVALATLLDSAPEDALRLCAALWPFWLRRIDLPQAQRAFEAALAAAPERTALRAEALLAAAAIDYRSGALERGLERAQESQGIALEIGDERARWRALQFHAEFWIARDAADQALPWLEEALGLARGEGFAGLAAIGIYTIGVAHWIVGDFDRAEELVAESIDRLRELADSSERIPAPVNIAELRSTRPGGLPGLGVVFEDSLHPLVEVTSDTAVSYALANQAGLARARGDLVRARALLEDSAARFDGSGDAAGSAAVAVRRAYLELAEGAVPAARTALEEALEARRGQGDRRGVGLVLAGLGLIDTTAGEYATAEQELAEARDLFRRAGDRWGLGSTLWRTADLAFARGDLDGAQAALEEARAVVGPTQRERWMANTLAGLAELALLRGEADRAATLLVDARDRYLARDDALGVAEVDERLGALAKQGLSDGKAGVR